VRTLSDSKIGGDYYRGSISLELYKGSLLQLAAQRLHKILSIDDKREENTRLFIGLLNPNS
ncbi:hypothetical protein BHE74_00047699, partial [Ensete ventricosum]